MLKIYFVILYAEYLGNLEIMKRFLDTCGYQIKEDTI